MAATFQSSLYASRRRRNRISMGLAFAATAFGLSWLVLILAVLLDIEIFTLEIGDGTPVLVEDRDVDQYTGGGSADWRPLLLCLREHGGHGEHDERGGVAHGTPR